MWGMEIPQSAAGGSVLLFFPGLCLSRFKHSQCLFYVTPFNIEPFWNCTMTLVRSRESLVGDTYCPGGHPVKHKDMRQLDVGHFWLWLREVAVQVGKPCIWSLTAEVNPLFSPSNACTDILVQVKIKTALEMAFTWDAINSLCLQSVTGCIF